MTYGLFLGIFWVLKYLFFIIAYTRPSFGNVYAFLTPLTPFIAYYLTARYKRDLGGNISFFHAWQFGVLLYFFAAIIVSPAHYYFFKHVISPEFMTEAFEKAIEMARSFNLNPDIIDEMQNNGMLSPITVVIQQIFQNLLGGVVLSIPVAALLCRNNQTGYIGRNQ